jgi:signal transduction histidine kinase
VAYGIPVLLAAYSCGTLEGAALRAGAALVAAMALALAVLDGDGQFSSILFYVLFLGVPWGGGRLMRGARQREELLEDRATLLEAQRDERARAAVEDERRRIARELHDVVSHAIAVVVLQARGGRRMLNADPPQARAAFDTIEETGTAALAEMRRLLGLLRADGEDPLMPQPSLARVDALAEQLRAAACPSTSRSGAGPARCRPASTSRPTASCRRR